MDKAHKVAAVAIILILIGLFFAIRHGKESSASSTYTIGIVQTASHSALDAVYQGFIERLEQRMVGISIKCVTQNAEGSISQAHAIAQQFHAQKKYDAFFAIASPAAQALNSVEKTTPIVIAAVTDPYALGIMYPQTNVCGIQDMIDVKAEIDMLIDLLPQAKNVGLLYTAGEINSITLAQLMSKELKARNLQVYDFVASGEIDIVTVMDSACRKSDVILAPNDNIVGSAITLLASRALAHNKPFIVSANLFVQHGPLAARGVDYYESGQRAADIMYEILINHAKPENIALERAKSETIFFNQNTALRLGISMPIAGKNNVVIVGREEHA